MARAYPYSHNVFGKRETPDFVRAIAAPGPPPEGWHVAMRGGAVAAAIHLKTYGPNHPRDHALWKLSHPLIDTGHSSTILAELIASVLHGLVVGRHATHKVVLHVAEHEGLCIEAARTVGLSHEGTLADYYRLSEACLIFGITIAPPVR